MIILLTGASSFTGYWFAKQLVSDGHEVICTFGTQRDAYEGVRQERVEQVAKVCKPWFGCHFGSDSFFDFLANEKTVDVLCHHGADVTNYKSADFDVMRAVTRNTLHIDRVLTALRDKGCTRCVLTGSVFEPGEGAGSDGLRSFSPYGLSKGLTAHVFRDGCQRRGLHLGKFVIPNPFGPYEEPRFTQYLVRCWLAGKVASCQTPDYVRDNIHVSLLAKGYGNFVNQPSTQAGFNKFNPSGRIQTQGDFALHFSQQMQRRLDLPCQVMLEKQTQWHEPKVRVNTHRLMFDDVEGESKAWDELATYYQKHLVDL